MAMYYLAFENIWFDKARYDDAEKNYYQQLITEQSPNVEDISKNAQNENANKNGYQQSSMEQSNVSVKAENNNARPRHAFKNKSIVSILCE